MLASSMLFRQLLYFVRLCGPRGERPESLTISGTVADTQSVPIADATVTLTTSGHGRAPCSRHERLRTVSASTGLMEGSYHLTFDHAGFEAATRSGQLNANLEVNVTLPVKGEVTSIDVVDVAGKATGSRLEVPNGELPVQISVIPQALLQQQASTAWWTR